MGVERIRRVVGRVVGSREVNFQPGRLESQILRVQHWDLETI